MCFVNVVVARHVSEDGETCLDSMEEVPKAQLVLCFQKLRSECIDFRHIFLGVSEQCFYMPLYSKVPKKVPK